MNERKSEEGGCRDGVWKSERDEAWPTVGILKVLSFPTFPFKFFLSFCCFIPTHAAHVTTIIYLFIMINGKFNTWRDLRWGTTEVV